MADITLLVPKILKWEGGYVNDPVDRGGCTNMGVTIAAYREIINPRGTCADVKAMTSADFQKVLRRYWNRWKADEIKDQKLANILVDWVWGSGAWGIKIPQRLLGVTQDGVVGPATLKALNAKDPVSFHAALYAAREKFLNDIVAGNPSQKRFIKGWMNRLRDFK